jgi:hypothetical protein
MHAAAGIEYFWLAGVSAGWSGTRESYNRPDANWNLFQNALEVPIVAGVSVDTNLVNPNVGGKLGAFSATGLIGPLNDTAARAKLRFTKRSPPPALFFESPDGVPIKHTVEWDDEHNVHHIEHRDFIEPSRMVSILEEKPDWSKVEVTLAHNDVGTVYQGYVRSSMLSSIAQMP